jgi:hypothetical protein
MSAATGRGRRSLWLLVAAVTMLLALVLPGAAQAGPVFITSGLPASVSGEQVAGASVTFVLDGQKLICTSFTYAGTLSTEAPETLTLAPTVKECKLGAVAATVELKECKFVLHGGEEVAEAEFSGTEDLSCPGSQVIKVSAGTCVAEIGTQNALAKVKYKSELSETEPSTFKTTDEVTGLKYKTTDGFLCPFTGSGEKTNGEITGSAKFSATDEESSALSVALSTAWIFGLVENYTAANQTTTIYWTNKTPGVYVISGQKLIDVINFAFADKIGATKEEPCEFGVAVVTTGVKACLFKIKTTAGATKPATSEVITNWAPSGAKVAQPLKSWVVYR